MKVSVFGPRELGEKQGKDVLAVWTEFKAKRSDVVYLHGGSKGTQELILGFEKAHKDSNIVLFKPWHMVDKTIQFTTKLMLKRNIQILDNSDLVFLFELGESSELSWTNNYCENNNIDVITVRNKKDD